jgi:cephalosporin hydroxylase
MQTWKGIHEAGRLAFRRFRRWRQQWIVQQFAKLYYDSPLREDLTKGTTWRDGVTTWLGIPCEKCPLDLWIYQELIVRTKPEIIVECGVNYGGSTLYYASILDILGQGEIVGIDITFRHLYKEVIKAHPRISLYESDSTEPAIVEVVRKRVAGRRTMVILDSEHSLAHVRRELELYADFVTPGCYLVVEDTNVNGHPVFSDNGPGPFEAV